MRGLSKAAQLGRERFKREMDHTMAPPLRTRLLNNTVSASLARIACSGECRCPTSLCRLLHSAIYDISGHARGEPDCFPREWGLLDTRNQACDEFIVRNWAGPDGRSTRLSDAVVRRGGLLGLLTSSASSVSVGRVASGVDRGVGLLLCGMATALTIPLPPHAAVTLDANWLCVLSRSPSDFSDDSEIERLMLMTWVILEGPLAPVESDGPFILCIKP